MSHPLTILLAGVMPLAGTFVSHRALGAVSARRIPPEIFCECRSGTPLDASGIDIVEFPSVKKLNVTWRHEQVRFDLETVACHPVKHLLDFEVK